MKLKLLKDFVEKNKVRFSLHLITENKYKELMDDFNQFLAQNYKKTILKFQKNKLNFEQRRERCKKALRKILQR